MSILRSLIFLVLVWSFLGLEAITLPDQFVIKERLTSWTTTFDIEDDHTHFGTVYRAPLTLTPEYHFYDCEERLDAQAIAHFFTWGTQFDLFNSEKWLLGSIEEQLFEFLPTYSIYSSQHKLVAIASLNFWGTQFQIYEPHDLHVIATLTRPMWKWDFKNIWTVKVIDRESFDRLDYRSFVVIVALQVDREHDTDKTDD